jgi:hypothetical protein
MDILNNIDFSITNCDISDIISESNRFLFHILLVHIITHIIDGKDELFGSQTIKTLFVTAIAILTYHVLFKKLVEPKLKKIKSVCKPSKKNKYVEATEDASINGLET